MDSTHIAINISYENIQCTNKRYESHVSPQISGLDGLRLRDIPETIDQRKSDGATFLEKAEVISLVDWKLYAIVSRIPIW